MKMRELAYCGPPEISLYLIVFYKPAMADKSHICLRVQMFSQHYRTIKHLMIIGKNKWVKEPPRGSHALPCSRPGED